LKAARFSPPDRSARVLIVQANISNNDKEYAQHGGGTRQFIVDKFLELTSKALAADPQPCDVCALAETAFPRSLSAASHASALSGAASTVLADETTRLDHGFYGFAQMKLSKRDVGARQIRADRQPVYSKRTCLRSANIFPLGLVSEDERVVPEISDFGRGGGPQILTLGG